MSYDRALTWLADHRNDDGSWGYLAGQPGEPEPTVLALAAGLEADVSWLQEHPLTWAELLVPAVLWGSEGTGAVCAAAVEHILAVQGLTFELNEIINHDGTIVGWSWVDNTACWVEPTAYALLSLRKAGQSAHDRAVQGEALLADRQCDDGGWNYGNPEVYFSRMESYLPPTGWATMAMPAGEATERAVERLLAARERPSALTLSLAILGRGAHGAPPAGLHDLLLARQGEDGSFAGRVDRTALAAAALRWVEHGVHAFVG